MPLAESTLAAWLLVLARLLGWLWFDPLAGRLPRSLRLMLAAALAMAFVPGVTALTVPAVFSGAHVLGLVLEFAWGTALALCVWLIFAAAEAMLVWTGHTATGGLLMLTPEQAAPADAAWRALAGWLAALAFLAASGHLMVVDALRDSLTAMPLAQLPEAPSLRQLAESAAWLFAAGVQLALPMLALALLIQLAWSIVARTVPGLDAWSAGLAVSVISLLAIWMVIAPQIAQGVTLGVTEWRAWLGYLMPGAQP